MIMKKQYMKPTTDVFEIKVKAQILTGSPTATIPFSDDPEDIIDDPMDIH